MDWYSWLSRTKLDPSLVYNYSLVFTNNELEKEDITHFNHEFLQSMGISIAKHRLEILKQANKTEQHSIIIKSPKPMARILAVINRTKNCITEYIRSLVHWENPAAIVVVHKPHSYYHEGEKSKRASMLKRSKKNSNKLVQLKCKAESNHLLLNVVATSPQLLMMHRSPSPLLYKYSETDKENTFDTGIRAVVGGDEDETVKEIRWDSLFQNLKPT